MKQNIDIPHPRYTAQKDSEGYGYAIVDSTGKDEPYPINAIDSLDEYERASLTPEGIVRYEATNKEVAEQWAYTWNLVELGYCGACQKQFAEGEVRYPAVGFHRLDKIICFNCACSQED